MHYNYDLKSNEKDHYEKYKDLSYKESFVMISDGFVGNYLLGLLGGLDGIVFAT